MDAPPRNGSESHETEGAPASGAPAPSRRVATAWGLFFSYASLAIALIRNLVLIPVYLRFISVEVYGAWAATGAVVAQLMISDFGLMGVVTQRTAAAYGARDFERLGRVIATSLSVAAGLSLLIGSVAALLSPWMPALMRLEGGDAAVLARCFLIVALANAVNLVALAAGGVLRSLQRPVVPGILAVFSDLLSVAVTLVLIFNDWGLYALAIGLASRSLTALAGNACGCLWVCSRQLRLRLRWDTRFLRSLWWDSYLQFLTAIAMRLHALADPFLVGVILGAEAAALFTISVRAHETVRLVWVQLGTAITPSLAHLHGEGDLPRFRHVFHVMTLVLALSSALGMAGVLAFNGAFVGLWVGAALFAGPALTICYSLFGVLDTLRVAPYNALYSQGRFAELCRGMWASTVVRLPAAALLLPLGMWIAPLTGMFGALVQTAIFTPIVVRGLRLPRKELVALGRRLIRVFAPPLALAAAILMFVDPPRTWASLAAWSVAFAGTALLLVSAFDRDAVRDLVREARNTLAIARER